MRVIIEYKESNGISIIEFDNLADAYSFTFDNDCHPAITTFEEKITIADMMRESWTSKPKAMSLKDAINLKKSRHNREREQN